MIGKQNGTLFFSVSISIAILFSSCGVGNHGFVAFSKRKYTSGHFSDPVAKANPVIPAKAFVRQATEQNISKSVETTPVVAKVAPQFGNGSGILNHISSFVQETSSHTILERLFPDNVKTENPDHVVGVPEHGNSQGASGSNYGEAGLLLTIFGIVGFLIGLILIIVALLGADSSGNQQSSSSNSSSNSNGNSDILEATLGVILAIGGPIAFLIGVVFNIMGANKKDKHMGAAIAGLIIGGLVVFLIIGAIL